MTGVAWILDNHFSEGCCMYGPFREGYCIDGYFSEGCCMDGHFSEGCCIALRLFLNIEGERF